MLSSVDPGNLQLILYTERQVRDAIQKMRSKAEYLEVLKLQLQPRGSAGAPAPPPRHSVLAAAQKEKTSVEGVEPPKFKKLRKCNMEQYTRLTLHLQEDGDFKPVPVNNRGDCLFASIRRCIDTPAEYTNTHFRRQMVMCLIEHKDFFWSLLKEHLRGNYGHVRLFKEDYERKQLLMLKGRTTFALDHSVLFPIWKHSPDLSSWGKRWT